MTMDVFLAQFSETLPAGVHAVLMLDQAGWHGRAALQVPGNITLLPLPPYSPELNPTRWSGYGSTYGSAFCLSACIGTSKP